MAGPGRDALALRARGALLPAAALLIPAALAALLLALPLGRLLRRLAREYRDWRAFERACRDLRRWE